MEQGWVKFFKDGQVETGSDREVRARTASWRHGRLEGLVSVDLRHKSVYVTLDASEGNWWQSDTMVSKFRGCGRVGETNFLVRRLEYQISEKDIGKFVSHTIDGIHTIVRVSSKLFPGPGEAIRLTVAHVGKWLYVSLDVQTNTVTISFHDEKK